jgi:mono/diheme cytochrome c family protein
LGAFWITVLCAEDFITEFEYGQMLYQDPRGASCVTCHGETGGGELIAEYPDKQGRIIALSGPDIRHASLEQIRQSVRDGKGVMPRYFLTDEETQTIHAYLQQVNRPKKSGVAGLFRQKD